MPLSVPLLLHALYVAAFATTTSKDAAESEVAIGLSFRKSIKLGAVRLNLSKSGVGVSTGVKGLRVSTGPRGTYLNAGRKGLYYRKRLGATGLASKPRSTSYLPLVILLMVLIFGLFGLLFAVVLAGLLSSP